MDSKVCIDDIEMTLAHDIVLDSPLFSVHVILDKSESSYVDCVMAQLVKGKPLPKHISSNSLSGLYFLNSIGATYVNDHIYVTLVFSSSTSDHQPD